MHVSTSRVARFIASTMILLATAQVCRAQRYNFQLYGQAEGLSNLVPLCMLQDRAGFLWVGTQNGLFRYDGTRFEMFDSTRGLPSSRVLSLFEDSDGSLIVATTGGLARSSGNQFKTIQFAATTARREGITTDANGRLYVATDNGLAVGTLEAISLLTAGSDPIAYSVYKDPARHRLGWLRRGICVLWTLENLFPPPRSCRARTGVISVRIRAEIYGSRASARYGFANRELKSSSPCHRSPGPV